MRRRDLEPVDMRDMATVYGWIALWLMAMVGSFSFFAWMQDRRPEPDRNSVVVVKAKAGPVLISGPTEVQR